MLVDTHCHLNFKAFSDNVAQVIKRARENGIGMMVVPGSDVATSRRAIALAKQEGIYAAVGIHPHHIYEYHASKQSPDDRLVADLARIEKLLTTPRVVAVGEVGIDRYYYRDTKYSTYAIDETFVTLQKKALERQIAFAVSCDKSLILHNRLAVDDILSVLGATWDEKLAGRTVFHCCEADEKLLAFSREKKIYIGVDGDSTWSKKKQRFIASVPLSMIVLETDSPYLTPEPVRQQKKFPNEPYNLIYVRDMVAAVKGIAAQEVERVTTENAMKLFKV